MADLPTYVLASLQLKDRDAFDSNYLPGAARSLTEAGAKILAATDTVDVREGTYEGNWTVLLEFASKAAFAAWYESDTYAPLIVARQSASNLENTFLLAFEGMPTPPAPTTEESVS